MTAPVKINEELIERGKALNRLLEDEGFKIVMAELDERIDYAKRCALGAYPGKEGTLFNSQAQYYYLNDFKEWIDDEIDKGGREIIRKQTLETSVE